MNQPLAFPDPLLLTVVLFTLAIGLPIVFVLAIRFLWDRSMNLGRSKELEKLIWQLHRIASAMEHQMNLTFPAVQPGTEEPHDLAYLRQLAPQPNATAVSQSVATPNVAAASATPPSAAQQTAPPLASPQPPFPPLRQEPPTETPRHGGVNSMFGF
jgi:hypothetical protein